MRANSPQSTPRPYGWGFTLIELLLVILVIALLAALVFPVFASARKASGRTACLSNLRQIGMAYQMYLQDHGHYPSPLQIAQGPYLPDRALFVCPQDTEDVPQGALSSYCFKTIVPPEFQELSTFSSLDPNVVLAACGHHTGQKLVAHKDDSTSLTAADYPFRLVVRAGGAVERVRLDQLRYLPIPNRMGALLQSYPGEPGYEKAVEK
jgi:prepilin-type N-terminal cleavage/methylation domain-containing protein